MDFEKKYLLAIESTGRICSVALFSIANFELISEYSIYVGNKHDRFLAELCYRILTDNNLKVVDLSAVAVSIGPGSFTGLRIGSAIAKGLCFDDTEDSGENCKSEKTENNIEKNHSIKLIAVPTLRALSYRVCVFLRTKNNLFANADYKILSIIPSHNDLVYEQLFDLQNNNLTEISFSKIDDIKNKYAKNELLFLSTNQKIEIDLGIYLSDFSQITGATVGRLAIQMYQNNEFTEPDKLVPLYIQDFIPKQPNGC